MRGMTRAEARGDGRGVRTLCPPSGSARKSRNEEWIRRPLGRGIMKNGEHAPKPRAAARTEKPGLAWAISSRRPLGL